MGKRLDALEEELRSSLKEFRTALDGQRKEHASHRGRVERQLAALVLGHAATMPKTPQSDETGTDESGRPGTRKGPPWWRSGEAAQREVADLIYEWRQARNWFIAAEERLGIALDWGTVPDFVVREESAEALAEPRTPRSALRSRRRYAQSKRVEHDMSEAG